MKIARRFAVLVFCLCFASAAFAQNEEFPGVRKAMSPEQFDAAGLSKLSPEERAKLDDFIRGYVSTSSKKAADVAVDQAVKEKKAMDPEVIESRIVGTFSGYRGNSRFLLENGQVWAQSQRDVRPYPPQENPPVIITKTKPWGYRIYVLGGGNVRVTKIR